MKIPPFVPESFEAMCARWRAALDPIYEIEKCERGEQQPPGLDRRHVFDFPDGVRMVVSRERDDPDTVDIHVSFGIVASFMPIWANAGQQRFKLRCEGIIGQLQIAGLVHLIRYHETTARAEHFFFSTK